MTDVESVRLTADVVATCDLDGQAHILLVRRRYEPFASCWALPGGHVERDETAEEAAARELEQETGVRVTHGQLEQVRAYTDPYRDPSGRVVTVGVRCHVPHVPAVAGDDAGEAAWWPLTSLAVHGGELRLAFDHDRIVADATTPRRHQTP